MPGLAAEGRASLGSVRRAPATSMSAVTLPGGRQSFWVPASLPAFPSLPSLQCPALSLGGPPRPGTALVPKDACDLGNEPTGLRKAHAELLELDADVNRGRVLSPFPRSQPRPASSGHPRWPLTYSLRWNPPHPASRRESWRPRHTSPHITGEERMRSRLWRSGVWKMGGIGVGWKAMRPTSPEGEHVHY